MEVTKKICKHFLEKKKRYCKFEVYKNSEFCCHHFGLEDEFVLCPIDPSHTVHKSNLEKHTQICPKIKYQKSLEQTVWYKENINIPNKDTLLHERDCTIEGAPEDNDDCKKKSKRYLQDMARTEPEQFKQLIEQISVAFTRARELYREAIMKQENISGIDVDVLCSEEYLLDVKGHVKVVDSSISDTQKNAKQCEDLVQTLNNFGILRKDVCYIEYGAGKGALSHHIAVTVKECSNILIEMEGRRHKMDKNHREDKVFYRIRANIKDFDINAVPLIVNGEKGDKEKEKDNTEETKEAKQKEYYTVGVSKHMCGLASDLTFYSILNASGPVVPLGFMIATCCHHRCTQELYMNPEFLDRIGVTGEMKKGFFHASSWGIYRENLEKGNYSMQDKEKEKEKEEDKEDGLKLTSDMKTMLGLQVKRTLDIGRILFLREKGFNCYSVKYCEKVYSPENFVIVGRKSNV